MSDEEKDGVEEAEENPAEESAEGEDEESKASLNEQYFSGDPEKEEEFDSENPEKATKESKVPKYLANPNKSNSVFCGLIFGFILSGIVSFIFNVKLLYMFSHMVKKLDRLYLMHRCLSNVVAVYIACALICVLIAFFLAITLKKRTCIILILIGMGTYYVQYKKIPYLQRLLVAKNILENRKWVPPFITSNWDNLVVRDIKKIVDTKIKISIQILSSSIRGVRNDTGETVWDFEFPEKSLDVLLSSFYVKGSTFYFRLSNKMVSRNVATGALNWTFKVRASKFSNLTADEDDFAFFCRKCNIPKVEIPKEKHVFYSAIVLVDSANGKLKHAVFMRESAKELRSHLPNIHVNNGSLYGMFEKRGELFVVKDGKLIAEDVSLNSSVRTKKSVKDIIAGNDKTESAIEEDQSALFFDKYLIFTSSKWIKFFDLSAKKLQWILNKGFLSSAGKDKDYQISIKKYSDILIFIERGIAYGVRYTTGEKVWGPKDGHFFGIPAMVGKKVFLSSTENGGTIYALQAAQGKFLYNWSQHRKIKEIISWNRYLIVRSSDNLGIPRVFGFLLEK